MNKQRYLAELQRLLVFMTEEDKERTVRRYSEMFDEAGEAGETELVGQIGSPTKVAIGLSRGYEPGKIKNLPEEEKKPKAALTQTVDDPWGDLPTFDLPDIAGGQTKEEKPAAAAGEKPKAPAPAEQESAPAAPRQTAYPGPMSAGWEEPELPEKEIRYVYERSMPLGLGAVLFALVTIAIGIPLAALFLCAMLALLAPGAAGLVGAYLAVVGGLWCMSYMADAIMLFGLAFLVLAVGLVVLWAGVWLDVRLAGVFVRLAKWLGGELLGRKVIEDA